MAATNANVELRSKKVSATAASPSSVWKYFGFRQDETDNDLPTCKLCLRKVRAAEGIQPKWVLLADPMADISLTTSADVRSDVFRDYCMGPFGGSPDSSLSGYAIWFHVLWDVNNHC